MRFSLWRALALVSTWLAVSVAVAAPPADPVQICDDVLEWPPYTFFQVEDGRKTNRVVGFSVDVIQHIFQRQGISYHLDLHPWRRCLFEVERGTQYQMLLSASSNAERRSKYLFSEPYYETHPYYFYSKKQFPQGLNIRSKEDLARYVIGGISGYNYDYLGVTAEQVNTESIDYRHLVLKLHHRKVDVFVEQIEVIRGFELAGKSYLRDPDLGRAPLPGMEPTRFHMLFTKNDKGRALKRIVDEGLRELQRSGRHGALVKKYFP